MTDTNPTTEYVNASDLEVGMTVVRDGYTIAEVEEYYHERKGQYRMAATYDVPSRLTLDVPTYAQIEVIR